MTVQKKNSRGPEPSDDEFVLPPELAAQLEEMNRNIDQHRMYEPPEEQMDVDPEDYQIFDEEKVMAAQAPQTPEGDPLAEYRLEILGRAAHVVTRDRNVQYGAPEDTFATIAGLWNAYLGGDSLLTTDVAAMLALLKIARLQANPGHEDSWVDLAGYAACGASNAKALMEQQPSDG